LPIRETRISVTVLYSHIQPNVLLLPLHPDSSPLCSTQIFSSHPSPLLTGPSPHRAAPRHFTLHNTPTPRHRTSIATACPRPTRQVPLGPNSCPMKLQKHHSPVRPTFPHLLTIEPVSSTPLLTSVHALAAPPSYRACSKHPHMCPARCPPTAHTPSALNTAPTPH
jgi:hypothetical protein